MVNWLANVDTANLNANDTTHAPSQSTDAPAAPAGAGLSVGAPGHRPALIAYATMVGPADGPGVWWLDVNYGAPLSGQSLPQMYRTEEIIGIPTLGPGAG